MFNIGPMEFIVLAIVLLVVVGPDRMPNLAKDAGRMLRTLREATTGARKQLRDELGPELAELDLRSLHPRTAIQKALFDDLDEDNPRKLLDEVNPKILFKDTGGTVAEPPSANGSRSTSDRPEGDRPNYGDAT